MPLAAVLVFACLSVASAKSGPADGQAQEGQPAQKKKTMPDVLKSLSQLEGERFATPGQTREQPLAIRRMMRAASPSADRTPAAAPGVETTPALIGDQTVMSWPAANEAVSRVNLGQPLQTPLPGEGRQEQPRSSLDFQRLPQAGSEPTKPAQSNETFAVAATLSLLTALAVLGTVLKGRNAKSPVGSRASLPLANAPVFQGLPSAAELDSAARDADSAFTIAATVVSSRKSREFLEFSRSKPREFLSSYARAFLRAGDYDTAYQLLKRLSQRKGWEETAMMLLRQVLGRRRGGTLFAAQEVYAERLELANAFSNAGLNEEAAGMLTDQVLEAAWREEGEAYIVADVLGRCGKAGEIVSEIKPGRKSGFYSVYARAFQQKGLDEPALVVLEKKPRVEWDRQDYATFVSLRGRLGTLDRIDPGSIPEEHRVLLVEALIDSGKFLEARSALQGIAGKLWRAREYGAGLRLCQKLDVAAEAKKLYQELVSKFPLGESADPRYYYAIMIEKAGRFAEAKAIYQELIAAFGGYRDAVRRLKNLEAISAEEITRVSSIAAAEALRKTLIGEQGPVAGLPIPAVVAQRFEIIAPLGVGGMGVVYKARDRRLDRMVALKRMQEGLAKKPEWRRRFLEEARVTAELRHSGIVDLYDVVESEDSLYLVFEFVDGETLEEIVASRGKLAAAECLRLLKSVCEALASAHARGVAHLDIKPSNIMRERSGNVKILDFGLARHVAGEGDIGGQVCGTPAYMAPEQHRGRPSIASDLFALGATFYELLAGALPFSGGLAEELYRVKRAEAYAPLGEDVPATLKNVIGSCLRADPAARPRNAEEVLAAV